MSLLSAWYSSYQDSNPEKFNTEFIYNRTNEEDIKRILESIASAMETISNIKFTGCTIETDESKFRDLHKIEESRLIQATLSFHLSCEVLGSTEVEEKDVSITLLLPRIIDNFFFKLNGNRYFAIYQLLDTGTYNINNGVGLKTMLMPFVVSKSPVEIVDVEDNSFRGNLMELDVFRRKVNVLLYFISECGIDETLNFFGFSEYFRINDSKESIDDNDTVFEIRKKVLFLHVSKDFLEKDTWFTHTFVTLLTKSKVSSLEEIYERSFWNFTLGKIYTQSRDQAEKKSAKIHKSIRRILDQCTIDTLVHVDPKDKKSIYHIFRWILYNFEDLYKEDNMDLKNKRLRLNEYILYPFTKKLSKETYRCLNSKKLTMKILESVFSNIKPNICITQLITSELLRYSGSVNTLDLFSSALKVTQSGPQGVASSDNLQVRYRGLHPSYLGAVGLHQASAGDPGVSLTLTPFVKLDGLYFDKTVKYKTPDSLPDEINLFEE